jgi:hypothetical protein
MNTLLKIMMVMALVAVAVHYANATIGVDVSQAVSVSSAQCMKKAGYSFAIVRCFRSSGSIDSSCAHSVANFWSAGFSHGMCWSRGEYNVPLFFLPFFFRLTTELLRLS